MSFDDVVAGQSVVRSNAAIIWSRVVVTVVGQGMWEGVGWRLSARSSAWRQQQRGIQLEVIEQCGMSGRHRWGRSTREWIPGVVASSAT